MKLLLVLLLSSFCFADDVYPPLPPISSSEVTITGTVTVDVTSSVLPTGAATETKQDTGNSSLSNIDSDTSSIDSKLSTTNSILGDIDTNTDGIESELGNILTELQQKTEPTDSQLVNGSLGRTWTLSSGTDSVSASVSNFPATQDVNLTQILSAAPSVTNYLPIRVSNGSSYVDPTQIRALTSSDQITVANASIPVTQSGTWTTGRTWSLSSGSDSVVADQGGSWSVTANAGTNLNTSALALAATQTDKSQFTRITDGTNDGSIKAASTAALAADTSFVVALSPNSPLPTGSNTIGALSANQSVNVNQYGGAATSLGQKVMASSVPVTVASDQSAISVNSTQDKNFGAVGANTLRTAAQVGNATGVADFDAGNSGSQTLRVVVATNQSSIPVTGPLTDAQLRATPVPVSGTVTVTPPANQSVNLSQVAGTTTAVNTGNADAGTQRVVIATNQPTLPISAASLPLPTGAATEATLSTRLADATFTTRINTQGQKTMAASTPVVVASDQSTIPVVVGINPVYQQITLVNGASEIMAVAGTLAVPVDFTYTVPAGVTNFLHEISMFIQHNGTADPQDFGAIAPELVNGVLIQVQSLGTLVDLATLKNNMHLGMVFSAFPQMVPTTSGWYNNSDTYAGSVLFDVPTRMQNSSGDFVRVRIRDNIAALNNFRMNIKISRRL